jgi:hypothetical protein
MMDADLHRAVADVLHDLGSEVETLGHELCADPEFAERHLEHLQRIDWFAQHLTQLAMVVGAADPAGAVNGLGLEELRARLCATPARAA